MPSVITRRGKDSTIDPFAECRQDSQVNSKTFRIAPDKHISLVLKDTDHAFHMLYTILNLNNTIPGS